MGSATGRNPPSPGAFAEAATPSDRPGRSGATAPVGKQRSLPPPTPPGPRPTSRGRHPAGSRASA
jgi:hypothetical protein